MPVFHVKVKWGKKIFPGLEINTDLPPSVFKCQLFSLTGVDPSRQKLLSKGVTIKDDWTVINIEEGQVFMLIGSAFELTAEPEPEPIVEENVIVLDDVDTFTYAAGLKNFGNSCYLNAVVQTLYIIPELKLVLNEEPLKNCKPVNLQLLRVLNDLWKVMKTKEYVAPLLLMNAMHQVCPAFAIKDENGSYTQQDANECWQAIVSAFKDCYPAIQPCKTYKNVADQLFGVDISTTYHCIDCETEPDSVITEQQLQLSCFITQEVKFLQKGIQLRMQEKIKKYCQSTNADAEYLKSSSFIRLPAYLKIEYIRFYYKEKERINAKILKDVKFPLVLDVFDMCHKDLQERVLPMRKKILAYDEKKGEEYRQKKFEDALISKKNPDNIDVESPYFEDDYGSNRSAMYELIAVVTHKGRSSNSGHYVSWVNIAQSCSPNHWVKYDDEAINTVSNNNILDLSGGGDWHSAYILLYRSRTIPSDFGHDVS